MKYIEPSDEILKISKEISDRKLREARQKQRADWWRDKIIDFLALIVSFAALVVAIIALIHS